MEGQVQCRVVNSADVRREFSGRPGLPASDVGKAVQNRGHMPPFEGWMRLSRTRTWRWGKVNRKGVPATGSAA